jgi:CheY-like chemotaxis protein
MSKKYILYIEDEDFQARLFSDIIETELAEYGYQVKTINNGTEFLKFVAGDLELDFSMDQVGIILLDLSIYDIAGLQILKNLQYYELDAKIAVFSAREDHEIIQQVKELKASEFFVKGKDINELNRLLKFIIETMKSS